MRPSVRVLAASVLLAVIGVAVAYKLYPRVESVAGYPVALSRQEAVAKARALALRYGRDVSEWRGETVTSQRDWFVDEVKADAPAMARSRIHAQSYTVVFSRGPWGPEHVIVRLLGTGNPIEFAYRHAGRPDFAGAPLTSVQEEMVLTDFGCEHRAHYRKVSSVESARGGHLTTWEWREEQMPDYAERIEVASAKDGVRRAVVRQDWTGAQAKQLARANRSGYRFLVMPPISVIAISMACAIFFSGWARGRVKTRRAGWLALGLLAIGLVRYAGGGGIESTIQNALLNNQPPPEPISTSLLLLLMFSAWLVAAWGAGRSMISRCGAAQVSRWLTLDAVIDLRWWRREVGVSVAAGLFLGAALAAVPAILCALPLFAHPEATTVDVGWVAEKRPALSALYEPLDVAFVLFLLLPLGLTAKTRSRWIHPMAQWALLGILAVTGVGFNRALVNDDLPGTVVVGAALTLAYGAIYWYADLLAALAASVGFRAAKIAIFLSYQSSEATRTSGIEVAGIYAALALLTGIAALMWARPLETPEAEGEGDTAAQREVLSAEFSLARQAQQRMLPDVPGRLGAFSLAASCHPARDVGGDLYDFFRYPDGSYGVCVADVSGKGVPAALYMTMTKGILAAASRELADLRGLALALNGYLYAAGRKKTFVTMALGRLDPEKRLLEHVRAGHNSILWRRAQRGESVYVKPRGVGLGLTSGLLFERSLELSRLEMDPGDVVVFYSDGITEAMNTGRELFGEERLAAAVERHQGLDAAGLEREILGEVRTFMGAEPPHDDMTLFVLRA